MDLQAFAPYLSVIEIILGVILTTLVVLQSKGGDLGSMMGGDPSGAFRTKRGLEAVLHRYTIYCAIAFFIMTLLTFVALGQAVAPVPVTG